MIENIFNKDILSFTIEKSCVDEKKVIGSFQKNIATIELLNSDNRYSNLKGAYIKTYKGTFYVNDITPVQEKIKIKLNCYDLTQKFDIKYDKNKFIFPMTLKEWKNRICEELNIEYYNYEFPNCNKLLTASPFIKEDATYLDVIKMIAQASSCWAIIDYNDKLLFDWFEDDSLVEVEDWFDLTTENEATNPVNVVVLGRGDVEENVKYPQALPENPKEIRIDSNEILDLDRKNMIVPIYNQVKGFKYIVFNMKTRGFLNAKVGDRIKYLDLFGNEKESYIMRHTLTFLGDDYTKERNYISKFEAVELDETNTNYKYAESPEQKLSRTERLANKLDGQILDVIETVNKYDAKISNVEQTVDKISQKVSEVADLTREISSNKYIEVNDAIIGNLIKLSITGEVSILPSKYIFPSENLFPHDAFYLKITGKEIDAETKEEVIVQRRYKLPFYSLHQVGDVKDEFVIYNGKAKLIKRIGVDSNDDKYVLTKEIELAHEDIVIPMFEGYNKIELVDFPSAFLSVKYAIQSEYSDTFATKAELGASITETKNEINLEVNKTLETETGTDALISKINMKPGEIKLEGTVTANDKFKVNLDGSVETTDLRLADGGRVIGGHGVLTNLCFPGVMRSQEFMVNGDFSKLGFSYTGMGAQKDKLMFSFNIPSTFTVESAKILLQHCPIQYSGEYTNTTGYSRNLRLYKTDLSSYKQTLQVELYVLGETGNGYIEIPKSIGENGFNPSSYGVSYVESIDLKDYIEKGKVNRLCIMSADSNPSDMNGCYQKSGACMAVLNVIGYMTSKEEGDKQ